MEQNRHEIVTENFHFFKIYTKESPMLQKTHINLERNFLVSETWHTIFLKQNHFFKIYTKESPMLQKIHISLERNLLVSET